MSANSSRLPQRSRDLLLDAPPSHSPAIVPPEKYSTAALHLLKLGFLEHPASYEKINSDETDGRALRRAIRRTPLGDAVVARLASTLRSGDPIRWAKDVDYLVKQVQRERDELYEIAEARRRARLAPKRTPHLDAEFTDAVSGIRVGAKGKRTRRPLPSADSLTASAVHAIREERRRHLEQGRELFEAKRAGTIDSAGIKAVAREAGVHPDTLERRIEVYERFVVDLHVPVERLVDLHDGALQSLARFADKTNVESLLAFAGRHPVGDVRRATTGRCQEDDEEAERIVDVACGLVKAKTKKEQLAQIASGFLVTQYRDAIEEPDAELAMCFLLRLVEEHCGVKLVALLRLTPETEALLRRARSSNEIFALSDRPVSHPELARLRSLRAELDAAVRGARDS